MMDLRKQKGAIMCKVITKDYQVCNRPLIPGAHGQLVCPCEQNHHPISRSRVSK